jgi:hypothetical protein
MKLTILRIGENLSENWIDNVVSSFRDQTGQDGQRDRLLTTGQSVLRCIVCSATIRDGLWQPIAEIAHTDGENMKDDKKAWMDRME